MSSEQIGAAVISLANEAIITDLLDWLYHYGRFEERLERHPEQRRYTEICIWLAGADSLPELRENFREMERLRDRNEEISQAFSSLCRLLDGAYNYIYNKKTKITPLQSRARKAILELRNGSPPLKMRSGGDLALADA